jgi:hypothetical protein
MTNTPTTFNADTQHTGPAVLTSTVLAVVMRVAGPVVTGVLPHGLGTPERQVSVRIGDVIVHLTDPRVAAVIRQRWDATVGLALRLRERVSQNEVLTRDGAGEADAVKIASMHRAKGTEFSHVIVIGAEAGVIPLDWVVDEQPEPERPAARGRERSLFYVACSRARDELVITWSGRPSPFLPTPAA